MNIVDNAPEMDLNDPKFSEMLASIKPGVKADEAKPEAKAEEKPAPAEKKDVKPADKPKEPASSAENTEDDTEDGDDDSPEKLKARVRGLQAELARRKGNADKVNELELQLAKVQGQLEEAAKRTAETKPKTIETAIRELDTKTLIAKQTDWEDELADARARYAAAEDRGDKDSMTEHGQRISYAKTVLSAIRTETLERGERKQKEDADAQSEATTIRAEFDAMYEVLDTQFPEFKDKDSALWKAGNKEYLDHPKIMQRLGPAGEIVAAALAVVKNPDLIGKKVKDESSVRKEVVRNLETGLKKALSTGAGAPSTGRTVVPSVDTGDGLAEFNKMVDRIKGG